MCGTKLIINYQTSTVGQGMLLFIQAEIKVETMSVKAHPTK